jgi:hypothetical protein
MQNPHIPELGHLGEICGILLPVTQMIVSGGQMSHYFGKFQPGRLPEMPPERPDHFHHSSGCLGSPISVFLLWPGDCESGKASELLCRQNIVLAVMFLMGTTGQVTGKADWALCAGGWHIVYTCTLDSFPPPQKQMYTLVLKQAKQAQGGLLDWVENPLRVVTHRNRGGLGHLCSGGDVHVAYLPRRRK